MAFKSALLLPRKGTAQKLYHRSTNATLGVFSAPQQSRRRPQVSIAIEDYLAGLTAREANQVNLNPEFPLALQLS